MTIYDFNQKVSAFASDIYYNFDLTIILEFICVSIIFLYVAALFYYANKTIYLRIKLFFNPKPHSISEEYNHYPVD